MRLSVRVEVEVDSVDPDIGQRLALAAAEALAIRPQVSTVLFASSVRRKDRT